MPDRIAYELLRFRTRDGGDTTVYLVRYPLGRDAACRCSGSPSRHGWTVGAGRRAYDEALVAGFFVRDPYRPLGEVRLGGAVVEHEPVEDAVGARCARACTSTATVRLAPLGELPEPAGTSSRPARCSSATGAR